MGSVQSHTVDPNGLYIHATAPPGLPISPTTAEGPRLIINILFCLLFGANSALYGVYLHLFGGRKGDRLILHMAVFISVASNGVLAIFGLVNYYQNNLIELYSEPGYNINAIRPLVVMFHTFQAIPVAIGQVYFALRIAKLFDHRRCIIRIGITLALLGVATQLFLMIWFGAALYSLGYKSHLADRNKLRWLKGIIKTWTGVFIGLEVLMTVTTAARLMVLRRQATMTAARRVIFRLAVYSVQGQLMLTIYSMSSLCFFSSSGHRKFIALYLLSGALYTLVLLTNLVYRAVVSNAMKQVQSDQRSAERAGTEQSTPAELNTVCTFPSASGEQVQLEQDLRRQSTRIEADGKYPASQLE